MSGAASARNDHSEGLRCRYLQEVSNRLFSEGLHEFGREPAEAELRAYLTAYLDGRLGDADIDAICTASPADLPAVKQRLLRAYPPAGNGSGAPALLCVLGKPWPWPLRRSGKARAVLRML